MLIIKIYYLTVFFCFTFCFQNTKSDLEISPEDIEYAVSRIAIRQRAIHSKSQPYFEYTTTLATKKSSIKYQQHDDDDDDADDMTQKQHSGGDIHHQTRPHNHLKMENNFKKLDATTSSTLNKLHSIEPQDEEQKMKKKEPQYHEQEAVEMKPIIENGVNQPHNHQNQQQKQEQKQKLHHLTVNQDKEKQQLSQHHFKLLNVVNRRNKRQTPAVNSNKNNNNNGNKQHQQQLQQFSSYTTQYYPYQQPQQEQPQQQLQQQQHQPQQYQLQYYQAGQQQQQQNLQNYNNIELIVNGNGNSLSTFSQLTAVATNMQQDQQQPMLITQPTSTSTPTHKLLAITQPTLSSTTSTPSTLPATSSGNSFKPFLPLEIINEFNDSPTTPPPPVVCKVCCIPNELPCSECCDGYPLLNAQTLKTLGG